MKTILLGLVLAIASTSAAAQTPRITEGDAFKPQVEMMRQVWKDNPGKSLTMTIPLYGRIMRVEIPAGFVPAYKVEGSGQFLFEFTQNEETVQNWTRLVTIRSIAGAGALPMDNVTLSERLFNPKTCAAEPIYKVLEEKDLGGGLSTMLIANGCGNTPSTAYVAAQEGSGEQNFIRLFRDAQSIYTVAIALRGKSFSADAPPVSEAEGRTLFAQFGRVRVCAPDDMDETCKATLALEKMRASQ